MPAADRDAFVSDESSPHPPRPACQLSAGMDLQLPSSSLGSKSHWDDAYDGEICNFEAHGDMGEVWFGEGITRKVVSWITSTCGDDRTAHILDLGCGNGHTLLLLHRQQFNHLTGIDYSEPAVSLAERIASKEKAVITFAVVDILRDDVPDADYDVVIDKGTFDAICLNPDATVTDSKRQYVRFVERSLKRGGYYILTSCNWTRDELVSHFGDHFVIVDEIASPSLTFAGKQGNRVTTLIWRKKDDDASKVSVVQ